MKYVTTKQAAELLGVTTVTVQKYVKQGRLVTGQKLHKGYTITLESIKEMPGYQFRQEKKEEPSLDKWQELETKLDKLTQFYQEAMERINKLTDKITQLQKNKNKSIQTKTNKDQVLGLNIRQKRDRGKLYWYAKKKVSGKEVVIYLGNEKLAEREIEKKILYWFDTHSQYNQQQYLTV